MPPSNDVLRYPPGSGQGRRTSCGLSAEERASGTSCSFKSTKEQIEGSVGDQCASLRYVIIASENEQAKVFKPDLRRPVRIRAAWRRVRGIAPKVSSCSSPSSRRLSP